MKLDINALSVKGMIIAVYLLNVRMRGDPGGGSSGNYNFGFLGQPNN